MGSFSVFHWLLVLAVVLMLFGAGKLPSVMADMAKGLKAFRSGLKEPGIDEPGFREDERPAGTPPEPAAHPQAIADRRAGIMAKQTEPITTAPPSR